MVVPVNGYLLLKKVEVSKESKNLQLVSTDFESTVSEVFQVVDSKSEEFPVGMKVFPNEHTAIETFYEGTRYFLVEESAIIAYIDDKTQD